MVVEGYGRLLRVFESSQGTGEVPNITISSDWLFHMLSKNSKKTGPDFKTLGLSEG